MKRLRPSALAVAAALAFTALGGCVSLPTNGPVNKAGLVGGIGSGQGVQLVARPPGPGWDPRQIVTGFLAASASSLPVARTYLTRRCQRHWHPALSSPTVIDSSLADVANAITSHPVSARVNTGPRLAGAQFTSDHVETLQGTGNIVVSPKRHIFPFSLIDTNDGWRISTLPSDTLLLLTQPDFQRDYQPRNLYFFAGDVPGGALVPYPIFIPEAQTQAGVLALTEKLLRQPTGWFAGATTTAFPPQTRISSVEVSGIKAVVSLDLPASTRLTGEQLHQMAAQLVWTLTSSPYRGGTSGIGSVQFVVRHHGPSQLLLPQNFSGSVPTLANGQLYFQALSPSGHPVIESPGQAGSAAVVPTPAGLGTGLFTAIAVSPSELAPTTLAACRGRNIYLAPLRWHARVIKRLLPSPAACTSLNWDSKGNLWATTANYVTKNMADIYQVATVVHNGLIVPGQVNAVLMGGLKLPAPSRQLPYRVLSFQVAPDGVRAAMIVQSRAGIEIVVAAISYPVAYVYVEQTGNAVHVVGSDISHPIALSWQNPNDLLVLGLQAGTQSYLYQVPLNGEPSSASIFPVPPGVKWLAVDRQGVAVGSAGRFTGLIWLSRNWNGPWTRSITGNTPVYSG